MMKMTKLNENEHEHDQDNYADPAFLRGSGVRMVLREVVWAHA